MIVGVFHVAASCCIALLLGACSGIDKRYGIDPVMKSEAVEASTNNQIRILNALARDAYVQTNSPYYWYEVSQAGFNYVDDECKVYFRQLFFLNRDKDQIRAGLAATGATSAAIMGVTGATAKSIATVAEAFGLAGVSTDLVAGTYLYQLPPATAQAFVRELQIAYRDGAASRRNYINSPTAAYHAIQDYLSLCLPPTIEAKIAEHVANARVVADPMSPNGGTSIGLTVTSMPAVTRTEIRAGILRDAETQIAPFRRNPPVVSLTRLGVEGSILPTEMHNIQKALCLPEADDLGPAGSPAREKLKAFLAPQNLDMPDRITPRARTLLSRLIRNHKTFPATCPPAS